MYEVRDYVEEKDLEQVALLYKLVWLQQDNQIINRLKRHASYSGFRCLVACNHDDEVIGFAYGYTSLSGQYYNSLLQQELDREKDFWLSDCFELVEVAVHPAYRRQKIGGALLEGLLEHTEQKTSVLTAQVDSDAALSFYESMGWNVITDSFSPVEGGPNYAIMGKVIREHVVSKSGRITHPR